MIGNQISADSSVTDPAPERPVGPQGRLVTVLAMLMTFAAIGLRWGLEPAVAVGTAVALGAAAAVITRGE